MSKALTYNATLIEREDLMEGLAVFRVRPDAPVTHGREGEPGFIPGQYLTIGLNRATDDPAAPAARAVRAVRAEGAARVEAAEPADSRPLSVRRPMSIASAPEDTRGIEFYIRYVSQPESTLPFTHLLWETKVGDRMYLRPVATGHFTLEDTTGTDPDRLKVMVAAGTGLAPFICIARSRLRRDPRARLDDLAILHGASYPAAIGYRAELERMRREHGLRYVPTISRPKEAPDWDGMGGRVEQLFAPDRLPEVERALGLEEGAIVPRRAGVMVCGLNGTIAECVKNLLPRGFVPNNRKLRKALEVDDTMPSTLFYEQYDTEPVIDVNDTVGMAELRTTLHRALG